MAADASRTLLPESFELIATRFRVLSDPLRLRLLHILQDREHSVGELVTEVQVSQPTVSKHLKVLHEAGVLNRRQEGTSVLYSIAEPEIFTMCELVCSTLERQMREQADETLRLLGATPS